MCRNRNIGPRPRWIAPPPYKTVNDVAVEEEVNPRTILARVEARGLSPDFIGNRMVLTSDEVKIVVGPWPPNEIVDEYGVTKVRPEVLAEQYGQTPDHIRSLRRDRIVSGMIHSGAIYIDPVAFEERIGCIYSGGIVSSN